MQKNQTCCKDEPFLKRLAELEDLAEKKAKIYSRLLTDASLSKEMEGLSMRHEKRKEELLALFGGKEVEKSSDKGVDDEA